jgi:hypothetical protein
MIKYFSEFKCFVFENGGSEFFPDFIILSFQRNATEQVGVKWWHFRKCPVPISSQDTDDRE